MGKNDDHQFTTEMFKGAGRGKESTTQLSVELFIAVNLTPHDGLKGNSPLGIHILNDKSSGGTLLIIKMKPC